MTFQKNNEAKLFVLTLVFLWAMSSLNAFAQEANETASEQNRKRTQIEISVGYVAPLLFNGKELERSKNLRASGKSYFERADGSRRDVGKYPSLSGFSFGILFYKPTQLLDGLMLGGSFKTSLTGSQPERGGYEEGYFFNFLSAGASVKYYPLQKTEFFVAADLGLASVFTKNRYKNEREEQNFFHQFGVGFGGSFSAGYTFSILKETPLSLIGQYDWSSARVEVNGIGDDNWTFGALNLILRLGL